jgi:hypothetical protein
MDSAYTVPPGACRHHQEQGITMGNQTLVQRASGRIATAAAVALLVPAVATAEDLGENRAASKSELTAIARAVDVPRGCIEGSVSARHEQWAAWSFRQPASRRCIRRVPAGQSIEGLTFVRRSGARWKRIASVSDCYRPKRVPISVWRDVGPLCGS